MKRIYLAGPEVFLPSPSTIALEKKSICTKYGFHGVFPMDADMKLTGLPAKTKGMQISLNNENLMRTSDVIIANMTPFRGPSMDVGTAFEMGFMRALSKPVFAYTNIDHFFFERTVAACYGTQKGEIWVDMIGMSIEQFGLMDNLMMEGAITSSCGHLVINKTVINEVDTELYSDLTGFEQCVKLVQRMFQ